MKSGTERIFEAYHWLQDHRNEFNKAVSGHVLLEINVSDRVHANYLEGHVPYYIWKMHSIGNYSWLDQVFNAPNAVKEVLTGQFGLDLSELIYFSTLLNTWGPRKLIKRLMRF